MLRFAFLLNPLFSKWLGLMGVILCSFTPFVLCYTFSPLSIPLIFSLFTLLSALSSALIYRKWHSTIKELQTREIDSTNLKEVSLEHLLSELTKKAQLSDVKLKILLDDEKELKFENLGWPYPLQIFVSSAVIESDGSGLSQTAIEALLAHELGHIQFYDFLFRQVLAFFVLLFRLTLIPFLLGLGFLVYGGGITLGVFIGVSLFCSSLVLAQHLFDKLTQRAREKLADSYAVRLTSISNVVNSFYECFLQYLFWNKMVIENNFAQSCSYILSDSAKTYLQAWQASMKPHPPKTVYLALRQKIQAILPMAAPQSVMPGATWFNNYPTLEERENALKLFER